MTLLIVLTIVTVAVMGLCAARDESRYVRGVNVMSQAMDRAAARNASRCEICSGKEIYLCPICRERIADHSHENDYICNTHGFVNPIRERDEMRINGDGHV